MSPASPRYFRITEWLTGGVFALLLMYLLLMKSGAGADGGGWALAMLLYAFMLLAAPPTLLLTLILVLVTHKHRKWPEFLLALLGIAATGAFDLWLRSSGIQPRGPLG